MNALQGLPLVAAAAAELAQEHPSIGVELSFEVVDGRMTCWITLRGENADGRTGIRRGLTSIELEAWPEAPRGEWLARGLVTQLACALGLPC